MAEEGEPSIKDIMARAQASAASEAPAPPAEPAESSKIPKKAGKGEGASASKAAEEEEEFGDWEDEEMMQGRGFGELEGLVRKSKRGYTIVTDAVVDAQEELQRLAFREVVRSLLADSREGVNISNARVLERSADVETAEEVAARAERVWERDFNKLSDPSSEIKFGENEDKEDSTWLNSYAREILKEYFETSVDPIEPETPTQQTVDSSWVHKEEAEIAKALNGVLARDRKRNKILQKLQQLGEKLTPEDAAEMARARVAAAEAAAAVASDQTKQVQSTFALNNAAQQRSHEREENALRALVKMDPDQTLEQLGLFKTVNSKRKPPTPVGPQKEDKTVTISAQ